MEEKGVYSNIRESRILTVLFLLLLAAVLFGLFYIFRPYIVSFLVAITLFFLLKGLHEKVLKLVRKKVISATIVVMLLCIVVISPITYILLSLGDQTYQLYYFLHEKINAGLIDRVHESEAFAGFLRFFDINETELVQKTMVFVRQYSLSLLKNITSILSVQFDIIVKFLCMILMLFFLLKDGANISSIIMRALPFPDELESRVADRLQKVINVLVVGNIVIMSLQGLMLGLGLYFAGFSSFVLWGVIGGFLSLIPVIGTSLVWIPAAIYLIVSGSYLTAIFIAIWALGWYFMLENLLKPVVFGGTLKFHPLLFFFLLLGSIKAFGMAGVIIGPIILTLFISLWEIYKLIDFYDIGKNNKNQEDTPA